MNAHMVQMRLQQAGLPNYRAVAEALRSTAHYPNAKTVLGDMRHIQGVVSRHAGREDYFQSPRGKTLQVLIFISNVIGEPVTPIVAPFINTAGVITNAA